MHSDPQSRPGDGLRFSVLGPLTGTAGGATLNLGGGKQQMVLALLLLEANRVVPVERLLAWVWRDSDSGGSAGTLQVYVSNLRRLLAGTSEQLDRQIIVTQRPGYMISLKPDELDLTIFDGLVHSGEKAANHGSHREAVEKFRAALSLWRGECLAGLPIGVSDSGITSRVDQARITVLEQTADAELSLGRHRELLAELQTWVAENPLDEKLRGHLMIALYRCGRQADALACYQQGRDLLLEDLGIDPSRELRELEARILNQDPVLDLRPDVRSPFLDVATTKLRDSVASPTAWIEIDGHTFSLDQTVSTIGRLPDRDVVLEDENVSRQHAEIRRRGGSYHVVDVGSANGTAVNGERTGEAELFDGDLIRFGETEVRFRSGTS